MKVNAYLLFGGNCEEAFEFYAKCLGGNISGFFRYESAPPGAMRGMPAEWGSKIMHVGMTIGDQALMGSDAPPGRFEKAQGFTVNIATPSVAEGKKIFEALSEKGTVTMPFSSTFWSPGFGMFTDRFGFPWMVNCDPA